MKTLVTLTSAAMVMGCVVALAIAGPANAASNKAVGGLDCSPRNREVHTISKTRGKITSQLYGAQSILTPWDHTSSIVGGTSTAIASWDIHHWPITKHKSGKVFASDVQSATAQCK